MRRKRCAVCKRLFEDGWTWQPFGPDSNSIFMAVGWHYRGFPALFVCDDCKGLIEGEGTVTFQYKKQSYTLEGNTVTRL